MFTLSNMVFIVVVVLIFVGYVAGAHFVVGMLAGQPV